MSAQVLAFNLSTQNRSTKVDSTQAAALFGEYMLMELVLEVARSSNDPQGRLADLFDRINDRARTGLTTDKPLAVDFRKHAETFFMMVAKNV